MKVKIKYDLLILNLLNVLLILFVIFLPSNAARIILGLPFILFFPGYVTLAALYPAKDGISGPHRLMLSFALSIAIVPLILLILNYTWGIFLNPILYAVAGFCAVISLAVWFRRRSKPESNRFIVEFYLRAPVWKGLRQPGTANKIISVIMVIAILGAIGTLVYVIKVPRTVDTYTEFYILGANKTAVDYPQFLKLGDEGRVTAGIINHEDKTMNYRVEVTINGVKTDEVQEITLAEDEKWEKEISFTPETAGTNQKIDFILYKNGDAEPSLNPLHIWVDVTE